MEVRTYRPSYSTKNHGPQLLSTYATSAMAANGKSGWPSEVDVLTQWCLCISLWKEPPRNSPTSLPWLSEPSYITFLSSTHHSLMCSDSPEHCCLYAIHLVQGRLYHLLPFFDGCHYNKYFSGIQDVTPQLVFYLLLKHTCHQRLSFLRGSH